MHVVCLDLEGVLVPEVWVSVAERIGVEALKKTTRDIPDYDELMRYRLALVEKHGLKVQDIQEVIAGLEPLPGAKVFLDNLRADHQLIILSDTFSQFATPLMKQLEWPTILCHELVLGEDGVIENYRLRQQDQKRKVVQALHGLNLKVVAAGDSYNDITMLSEADGGILFCPPDNVIKEFPQYPVVRDYDALRAAIEKIVERF
ncbi:MAG: bifunctional phosphoserine phosphatase/homoserine phosphotransferase ThrH [Proteobacteria bacterium]|jgi:phosphoserine / homoserine phosphotransferase|nr:bifunctional phosphoserine phosphatase/homoserine phosphotransferase ThrH [Pseudomonadota bacterium]